jgi:SIR2-like domain/TIR domain
MAAMNETSGDLQQRQAGPTPRQARVFISYRKDDAWAEAQLLYERLANQFGSENVFLDARNLQPGMEWLKEIKSHRASCDALLALIGPHWVSILKAREQQAIVQPAQDYVRYEIEYALRPDSGICVIPVLMGDDVPFTGQVLPWSLQPLTKIEVAQVRQKRFEEDVADLISRLEAIACQQPEPTPELGTEERADPGEDDAKGVVVPPPDAGHFEDVLRQMVDQGNLVVFLGSRLGAGQVDPLQGPGSKELAAKLAERFDLEPAGRDLPEVAQYVYVREGSPDLYRELKRLLASECEPGPVHKFLARLPRTLEELGLDKRYQLIVSTNFDTLLEQAFDAEREPYDLAVYMASGRDKGKFVHFPSEGSPKAIAEPNSYTKLPIGGDYELQRTLIVKIHGAVDGNLGDYRWKENYVITEDHYIDYLSQSPIESLVPVQVLDKLQDSHCLFLGYTVHDWNLRVFLKRIWEGRLGARSWAVEPDPDDFDKYLWAQSNVDLYTADLAGYMEKLKKRLIARAREHRARER